MSSRDFTRACGFLVAVSLLLLAVGGAQAFPVRDEALARPA